ncbi:MAG: hypothetical protein RSC29_04770, partial [Oscillospiraceae bacterium]
MLNVFKGFSKKVKENKVFKILWDNKKSLLILSIVSFLLIATYSFLETSNKSYMNLTMSYPGAEKGENPDGSRFNVFEFKSDEVINRALETGKINNMTVEEIKDRVDIYA